MITMNAKMLNVSLFSDILMHFKMQSVILRSVVMLSVILLHIILIHAKMLRVILKCFYLLSVIDCVLFCCASFGKMSWQPSLKLGKKLKVCFPRKESRSCNSILIKITSTEHSVFQEKKSFVDVIIRLFYVTNYHKHLRI
jgi:hypothetical protein